MSSLALASDVDVGAVLLQAAAGKQLGPVRVDQRVTDGTLERTMDGASTLTLIVDDHDRALLRSGAFSRQLDLQLFGEWWRLVQVAKAGDQLTLTFEDRAVAYLRKITTPRKAARSKMTRAQFALSIVREVKAGGGIPFVSPDVAVKQPIAKASQKPTAATKAASAGQGIAAGAKVTVKHAPASGEQRKNAERVLDVAASLNAGTRASLALIQACIQENSLTNSSTPSADGHGSTGILQLLPSTARGLGISALDVEACANAFLTKGFYADPQMGAGGAILKAAKFPSATTGRVAQAVQGSAYPTYYDQWKSEAEAWLAAYGGPAGGPGSYQTTTTVPYQFQRGGTAGTVEDSWTCLQRLASEVGWRCFMVDGACWFVAETTLAKAKPRATLSELTIGVDVIDFDIDNGKASSEATVTARIARLGFPPGSVVVLEDCGPGDGRWLVQTVTRNVFDAQGSVTLKRVTQPLPEPAADTTTAAPTGSTQFGFGGDPAGTAGGGTATPEVDRVYAAAKAMDAKRYPYVWGGGHASCGTPSGGPPVGFDCSGSTCAVLAAADLGFHFGGPVDVSGTIAASWGDPGEGQYLTVWANGIHVWMEFKTSGGAQHFGTGDWGSDTGTGGPAFQARMHDKGGFTPRHWAGT